MPAPVVKAFGILKGAAATVNMKYGLGKCVPVRVGSGRSLTCNERS